MLDNKEKVRYYKVISNEFASTSPSQYVVAASQHYRCHTVLDHRSSLSQRRSHIAQPSQLRRYMIAATSQQHRSHKEHYRANSLLILFFIISGMYGRPLAWQPPANIQQTRNPPAHSFMRIFTLITFNFVTPLKRYGASAMDTDWRGVPPGRGQFSSRILSYQALTSELF